MLGTARFTLRCSPDGGTLPGATRVCELLARNPSLLLAPKPFTCVGGLTSWWTIDARGTLHGKRVRTHFATCWTPQQALIRALDLHWKTLLRRIGQGRITVRGSSAGGHVGVSVTLTRLPAGSSLSTPVMRLHRRSHVLWSEPVPPEAFRVLVTRNQCAGSPGCLLRQPTDACATTVRVPRRTQIVVTVLWQLAGPCVITSGRA
jgi:hypothetical protein